MIRIETTAQKGDGLPPKDFILGLDLGKSQDFTALAVLERSWERLPGTGRLVPSFLCNWLARWPLMSPYPAIVEDLVAFVKRPPLAGRRPLCAVDESGVGAPVIDQVRQAKPECRVVPVLITTGHAATRTPAGGWHVAKKVLVSNLAVLLQSKRLRIAALPEREALAEELTNFKERATPGGSTAYEADAAGDWRTGSPHDDMVLAVCLAAFVGVWHPPYTGPGVAGGTRPLFGVAGQPLESRAARGEAARAARLAGPPGGLVDPGTWTLPPGWRGGP